MSDIMYAIGLCLAFIAGMWVWVIIDIRRKP